MMDQKACTEQNPERWRECIFWDGCVCWDGGRAECHHITLEEVRMALQLTAKGERVTG